MRRRRILLLFTGCALTAILATLLWPTEPEPYYRGKSLSEWLVQYHNPATPADTRAAEIAVRQIGPDALPFLLKWIHHEPLRLKARLLAAVERVPGLRGRRILSPLRSNYKWEP